MWTPKFNEDLILHVLKQGKASDPL